MGGGSGGRSSQSDSVSLEDGLTNQCAPPSHHTAAQPGASRPESVATFTQVGPSDHLHVTSLLGGLPIFSAFRGTCVVCLPAYLSLLAGMSYRFGGIMFPRPYHIALLFFSLIAQDVGRRLGISRSDVVRALLCLVCPVNRSREHCFCGSTCPRPRQDLGKGTKEPCLEVRPRVSSQ